MFHSEQTETSITSTSRRRLGALIAAGALAGGVILAGATVAPGVTAANAAGATVVSSSSELTSALRDARPGQTITLRDGTYTGKFKAAAAGTSGAPITLTGSRKAVLTTGSDSSGYGLHVTGDYWNLTGFSVSGAQKGIMLDDSDSTVLSGLDVGRTGQEAIHVRHSSSNVVVRDSVVHDTGLQTAAYGEGIYVGSANSNWKSVMGSSSTPDKSDGVRIENNRISNTTAEGIDIKEGTTGGRLTGNVFTNSGFSGANYADSWVDIKGNGYTVSGNSGSSTRTDAFQVHSVLSGWGGKNVFSENDVVSGVPGYEVNIASKASGNVVSCKSSGADSGLTNVTCR